MVARVSPLRQLWQDTMTVTCFQEYEQVNGATGFREVLLYQDVLCKLSFSTLQAVVQVVKIFCDPSLLIPAGSLLTVTHKGRVFTYARSGEPAVFSDHQEIILIPPERK